MIGEVDAAWNPRACLDWIERSELFIISLDNRREWYRYHHLFKELLQQRLAVETTPDQLNDLHIRASVWFEEHGFMDEALHHALAAGDLNLATRQMNDGLCNLINREDRPTMERWLRLLPEENIRENPGLLMIRIWALELSWRLDLQAQVLQQVEELLDSGGGASLPANDLQILRGQILMLRAQYAYFSNQTTRAIDLCREALALLPPKWSFVRGAAILYLGLSMQATGQIQEAEKLLLTEYESCSDKTGIYPLIVLQTLGYIYIWTCQLEKAIQIGQVLIQGATSSSIAIVKNWGDYYLGVAHYQRNELEIAEQYFTQITENQFLAHGSAYHDAVAGMALIHQIMGKQSESRRMVELISQFDLEQGGIEDDRTSSLRARLMLLQGDPEGAGRWADTFSDLPPDQPIIWLEEPQMTRARALVARGTDADLRLALQILDVLNEIVNRTHNTYYEIEILALRALVLDSQGDTCACGRRADAGARPGAVGGLHPGVRQPGQTYAEDAAPLI